jgi:hypothetical protein
MDPKTVEKLEEKIEEAIAEIIVKMGLKKLPLLPARQTMHLMAKAAVTVHEAAVENWRPEDAMTFDDFRTIALSLPDAFESAHMDHPDFRVCGKIFATIWPDEGWGMVKLTLEQQSLFMRDEPEVFVPVKGGWGRKGATNVRLESANPTIVRNALVTAWRNIAPKKIAMKLEDDDGCNAR